MCSLNDMEIFNCVQSVQRLALLFAPKNLCCHGMVGHQSTRSEEEGMGKVVFLTTWRHNERDGLLVFKGSSDLKEFAVRNAE